MTDISYMQLLAGDVVSIEGLCKIHPLTLREIKDIGEERYNEYLKVFLLSKDKIDSSKVSENGLETIKNISDFEFLLLVCLQDNDFLNLTIESLSCLLREEINIDLQNGFFYIGDLFDEKIINEELFNNIKEIVKKQNYIKEDQEKKYNPYNDKAKELIEKMKKVKEKLKKKNQDDGLELGDIISIVSAYSHDINIFNIWDLKVYQLYEIYIRLIMWDEYHNNFTLLPHVEDSKKLDMKHWGGKVKTNNQEE